MALDGIFLRQIKNEIEKINVKTIRSAIELKETLSNEKKH